MDHYKCCHLALAVDTKYSTVTGTESALRLQRTDIHHVLSSFQLLDFTRLWNAWRSGAPGKEDMPLPLCLGSINAVYDLVQTC